MNSRISYDRPRAIVFSITAVVLLLGVHTSNAQARDDRGGEEEWFVGRWDVTIETPEGAYPTWFEITNSTGGVEGRFQGQHSSWRPIESIDVDGKRLRIALPSYAYEREDQAQITLTGNLVEGEITGVNDQGFHFVAERAPVLEAPDHVSWGEPIILLAEQNLEQWSSRVDGPSGWTLQNGILKADPPCFDMVTKQEFQDFKLHVEFSVSPKGNSGVYLRGRYELQIVDDHGKEPSSHGSGGLYGFVTPTSTETKPAGEWNTWDVTFVGREVSLVYNGKQVIESEEVPGITGSALDSKEAEPGPIMLQCHNTPVSYRNIVITPTQ